MSFPSLPAVLNPPLTGRDAVADAVYRCVNALDINDAALFQSAFTLDAVFDLNGNVMEGLTAIMEHGFSSVSKLDTTHFITNMRINLDGDLTASASCSALAQHFGGGQGMEAGAAQLLAGNLYWLELVKDPVDGLWKIKTFKLKSVWSQGDWGIMAAKYCCDLRGRNAGTSSTTENSTAVVLVNEHEFLSAVMKSLRTVLQWLYEEFGIRSVRETGRNAYLIVLARCLRMVSGAACSLVFPLYFSNLEYSDAQIGLFMTLTMVGDVCLGTYVALIADQVGRRRVLVCGSFFMILSGLIMSTVENYWILLLCAISSVISVTGGEYGPFRSVEESILSHLTEGKARSDVLAWYVTLSTLGSSIGAAAAGRAVDLLKDSSGWTIGNAYHAVFSIYLLTGVLNLVLALSLTVDCEIHLASGKVYERIARRASEDIEMNEQETECDDIPPPNSPSSISTWNRRLTSATTMISPVSASTRSVMYKLWPLLALDAVADGMVPYSLTTYFFDFKFHPAKSTLGDITSAGFFMAAVSATFAGPLARRIGLVNTMVMTHIPSSAAVLLFPFPSHLWMMVVLFFIRTGLNDMDQAPRSAFIAAVVQPSETTAVMGITSTLRTIAATFGPSVTGILAVNNTFWFAFVAAGVFRLTYDVGLYKLFIGHEISKDQVSRPEADA